MKDSISNLLAGVLIMIYRPFDDDDKIRVSSFEGRVLRIDMRYTQLQSNDGQTIFVPNSLLFTNAITVDKDGTQEPDSSSAQV